MTMMRSVLLLVSLFCVTVSTASAQRLVGTDTLYGNEWITHDEYVKIKTTKTGMHRVSGAELFSSGLGSFVGSDLQLLCNGSELPLFVSTTSQFGANDFIEFYVGTEIMASYHSELFESGEDGVLNRDYPLFSDTTVLALTISSGQNLRFSEVGHNPASLPLPEEMAWSIAKASQSTLFAKREWLADRPKYSHFSDGEGWANGFVASQRKVFSLPQLVTGQRGEISYRAVNSYSLAQLGDRVLTASIGSVELQRDVTASNVFIRSSATIPSSSLAATTSVLFKGNSGSFDRWGIGEARIKYKATLQAGGNQLIRYVDSAATTSGRHLWSGLDPTLSYRVYDIQNKRIQTLPRGTEAISTFSNLEIDDQLILVNDQQAYSANVASWELELPQLPPAVDYLIITDRNFESWENTPTGYANERARPEYGGYNVAVWYFDEIRDVFGYGQIGDASCVRNAIQYAKANSRLEYVLILGKGREFDKVRTTPQLADILNSSFSIPTFGTPGSDALMCANSISGTLDVAIGRLPVESSDDLGIVQRKIFEAADALNNPQSIEERAWMKRIFHLGGGGNSLEQAQLRSLLLNLRQAIESSKFGPEFKEYYKDSDTPIQQAENEELFSDLNEGASIVTVFGHSSPGAFDFNIDNAEGYNNRGRYPLLLGLGCYSGSMHLPGKSIGERFLVLEDKGFVGFGATVGLGYPNDLTAFTRQFYVAFGEAEYDKPVGIAFKSAYNAALSSTSITYQQLGEQFTYNGDPATRLYKHEGPDFVVDEESFVSNANEIGLLDASMNISFEVRNLGTVISDSIRVLIERESASRTRTQIDSFVIAAPAVVGTFSRQIDTWGIEGAGLNQVWINIEPFMAGEEQPQPLATQNNQTSALTFFIRDEGLDLLWPRPMAALSKDSLVLYAAERDPFAPAVEYVWEISEDASFSTVLVSTNMLGRGLMSWIPTVTDLEEGGLYYWRVFERQNPTAVSKVNAFTVNNGVVSPTFLLAAPVQLRPFSSGTLSVDSVGNWNYNNLGFFITLRTKEFIPTDPPAYIYDFGISALSVRPWNYMNKGLAVVVADKVTGSALRNNDPVSSGSIPTGRSRVFAFPTETPGEREKFINFIDNQLPDSSMVWVFTTYHQNQEYDFQAWKADSVTVGDRTIFSALRDRGASLVDTWGEGSTAPYNFIFRNNYNILDESYGADRNDIIVSENFIATPGFEGVFLSGPLPPAVSYESLSYTIEEGHLDTLSVELVASVHQDSFRVIERLDMRTGVFDMSQLPSLVSGETYRLRVVQANEQSRIARGINSISLEYEPLPEIVYDPASELVISPDTINQAEQYEFSIALTNVSSTPIPTLNIISLGIENGGTEQLKQDTFDVISPWETIVYRSNYATEDWPLERELIWRSILPQTNEFNVLNNLAQRSINLIEDSVPPILQVTLDGSPPPVDVALVTQPIFGFSVTDNDIYRAIGVEQLMLELTYPDGTLISGDDLEGVVSLESTKITDRSQRVEFKFEPTDLPDGIYSLDAAVLDASGNQLQSKVSLAFEVVNKTSVSGVIPYPNPGIDNIRFQYEATGVVPDSYQIDIYTSSGRRVKSLGPSDLGLLQTGRHLTTGSWDGTDDYGQLLARGLYLYRFQVEDVQDDREHRETDIDNWVKNGFGKLVLLR